MSGKTINFNDKKNRRSDFYKNKKIFKIGNNDVNNILVSKKEPHGTKSSLNTLLDIMIIILLDYFV